MNEFLLIFRKDNSKEAQPSPAELQESIQPWQEWLGKLQAEGALVSHGNRLRPEGTVIKAGKVVTDGPYPDIKESIGGFIIVKAEDLAAATEIGKGCPVLNAPWNGFVEVRMLLKEA